MSISPVAPKSTPSFSLRRAFEEQWPPQDRKALVILLYTAVAMTVNYYFARHANAVATLRLFGIARGADAAARFVSESANPQLLALQWWVSFFVLTYIVLPALLVTRLFRESLADYGVRFRGALRDWKIFLALLVIVLPIIWHFSATPAFQNRYPFYRLAPGEPLSAALLTWEAFYLVQFAGTEFFYRGLLVQGLRERFGTLSVAVMVVPYTMIHFNKPFPETVGAIIAGMVLGSLSFRSRSIVLGVLLHWAVALTMDAASLWHRGVL
ncbi:MAG: type II CAAX endopeptidase family protein [Gemmatimonadetes bacterium]|nr:type II CAAX endopeptidase family protein [Gemmatimonadota bacterium]